MLNYLNFCARQVSKLLLTLLGSCFPVIIMSLDKPGLTSVKARRNFYVGILHPAFRLEKLIKQLKKGSFNVRSSDTHVF